MRSIEEALPNRRRIEVSQGDLSVLESMSIHFPCDDMGSVLHVLRFSGVDLIVQLCAYEDVSRQLDRPIKLTFASVHPGEGDGFEFELLIKPPKQGRSRLYVSFPCPDDHGSDGEHCYVFDCIEFTRVLGEEIEHLPSETKVDWDQELRTLAGWSADSTGASGT